MHFLFRLPPNNIPLADENPLAAELAGNPLVKLMPFGVESVWGGQEALITDPHFRLSQIHDNHMISGMTKSLNEESIVLQY
jgi:hypothetical protein